MVKNNKYNIMIENKKTVKTTMLKTTGQFSGINR